MRELALDQVLGLVEFRDGRDHRKHDLQRAAAAGAQQRAQLRAQQGRPVEPEADRAPAERRILLFDVAHVGQHLVAADVEGAERHRLAVGGLDHGAIERVLLAGARKIRRYHELQLGAEQADARGPGIGDMRQVDAQPGIDQQSDLFAVPGHAGKIAQRLVLLLPPCPQPHALDIGGLHVRQRPQVQIARPSRRR